MFLPASGGRTVLGLWLQNLPLCLSLHMASSLYLCLPLLIRTIISEFRAHLGNLGCSQLEILNLITSFETLPQIRSRFRGSGKGISFGDHYSTSCNVLVDHEE